MRRGAVNILLSHLKGKCATLSGLARAASMPLSTVKLAVKRAEAAGLICKLRMGPYNLYCGDAEAARRTLAELVGRVEALLRSGRGSVAAVYTGDAAAGLNKVMVAAFLEEAFGDAVMVRAPRKFVVVRDRALANLARYAESLIAVAEAKA
jgi:DNA-binding transcriptional ArsR family regulator